MTARVVLVTGATGFVGSAVVERLVQEGVPVRVLAHRADVPSGVGVEGVRGDLVRSGSLRGLCDGVATVLHLAARIGGTEQECRAVNAEGTRALLAEAERAGVRRIVQLGTAAVYRDGAHRGAVEGELAEEPESVTSVTRLVGERMVLAAGGAVVRPHLVYGRGDRWVVPSLVRLLARLPYWVDGGRARMSVVSVDALAGAIAELAVREEGVRGVLHAGHPEPVTARELVGTVARELGLPLPRGEVDLSGALELLGGPEGPDPVVRRQVSLFAVDHWYDSGRLWGQLAASPGARFSQAFGQYAGWYRGEERMRRR
ncbi:NAD-dependent epimerase/dehydratase family protein [Streptomyces sp. NBC_01233]|uniref:NAD-dependent epimerase/dehydratase family protein n=1 Tax=Streptomyces sp. NBC_01233 TaxID=2903787 RepID=UPI002E130E0A|nr:NAD-dependent epimerase/dehydratase family protein [Streptomyces sp. NBC_01233]WSP95263.1 NAD-dependent epimerase/dehydratase family protein [Streptomyces sp. NBC_01233]